VRAARGGSTPEARAALSELCERYWYPIYAYIRRRGYPASDAQDLTQDFFARLIEKDQVSEADPERGRFRAFLLTSVNCFLANQRDYNQRARRMPPGGWIEMDLARAESRLEIDPVDHADPETLYLRDWASAVIRRGATRLEDEYRAKGRERVFAQLGRFAISDDDGIDYRTIGRELQTSDVHARVLLCRMRKRLRELIAQEIEQTVTELIDVERELEVLREALR
jgi:RNA polymerase sigma factor (sigma-70 family)